MSTSTKLKHDYECKNEYFKKSTNTSTGLKNFNSKVHVYVYINVYIHKFEYLTYYTITWFILNLSYI